MQNWENKVDLASAGITQRMKMRDAMRLVILNVMHRNGIDAFVNPTITLPPARIGYASQPSGQQPARTAASRRARISASRR